MAAEIARKATIRMLYKGLDITGYCTDFTFTSKSHGELDAITLKLQDRDGRVWQGHKWPLRGDILEPVIITHNWKKQKEYRELVCGVFELDMPTVTGPPDVIDLKGTSRKTKTAVQMEKKTTGWEEVTLEQVAGDIAGRNGYKLDWRGKDKFYVRLDQKEEGDLSFLERHAREAGNGIHIKDHAIEVIDLEKLEHQPPSFLFRRLQSFFDGPAIIDYRFSGEVHDKFKCCRVVWQDTETGEIIHGTYDDPEIPSGESLRICDKRVFSKGEAEALAREILLEKNRPDIKAELTIPGDTDIVAGLTCDLEQFGGYSGRYLIRSAVHSPLGRYTVKLNMQKVK